MFTISHAKLRSHVCSIFNSLFNGACLVETLAWGIEDTESYTVVIGYVTINKVVWLKTVADGKWRGFNTVELALNNCSAVNIRHFDTHGSYADSDALAAYITNLPPTTILIGVTADSADGSLTAAAKSALLSIGIDVTQLQYRGKVAFVAQAGRPSAALVNLAPRFGDHAKLNAIVCRTYGELYYRLCARC